MRDIYVVAGINPDVPVTMGLLNFRFACAGFAEPSFVCPDAFCRRQLPTYIAQLEHNVPQAGLAVMNLAQPHAGNANINARNFVHRPATNKRPAY